MNFDGATFMPQAGGTAIGDKATKLNVFMTRLCGEAEFGECTGKLAGARWMLKRKLGGTGNRASTKGNRFIGHDIVSAVSALFAKLFWQFPVAELQLIS